MPEAAGSWRRSTGWSRRASPDRLPPSGRGSLLHRPANALIACSMDRRPTAYDPEIARRLCLSVAAGELLPQVCADPDMPDGLTVMEWAFDHTGFRQLLERADALACEVMAQEILDIAAA